MSSKTRVQTRLKQAVGASQSRNKCIDLKTATENFEVIKKRLKLLIESLKAHHEALIQVHKTRMDAVGLVATLSLNTPVFGCAGQLSNEGNEATSYASVHSSMGAQQKMFLDRYGQYVVNYVVEWEKVLTERISQGLKKSEEMRIELDHYEEKIKPIRIAVNVAVAKEKKVDAKLMEKYQRNEEKFTTAKVNYEKFVHSLAVLIDEATLRSWKDLHPLLVKMTQFDVTVARSDAKALGGLDQVVSKLQIFSQEHHLKQSRLKDLQSMDAFDLSGINEQEYLALNASNVTNIYIKVENEAHGVFDTSNGSLDFLSADGTSNLPAITQGPTSFDNETRLVAHRSASNNFDTFDMVQPTSTGLEFKMLANEKNGEQKSSPPTRMDALNNSTNNLTLSVEKSHNYVSGYPRSNSGTDSSNSTNGFNNNPGQHSNMNNFTNNMTNVNDNSGSNNMNNFNLNDNAGYNGNNNSLSNNSGLVGTMNNFDNNRSDKNNNLNNFNQFGKTPANANVPLLHAPMPSNAPPSPPSVINPFPNPNNNGGHSGMHNGGGVNPFPNSNNNGVHSGMHNGGVVNPFPNSNNNGGHSGMHNGGVVNPFPNANNNGGHSGIHNGGGVNPFPNANTNGGHSGMHNGSMLTQYGAQQQNKQLQQMNSMTYYRSNSSGFGPYSNQNQNQNQNKQLALALPSANANGMNSSNSYANPFKNTQ